MPIIRSGLNSRLYLTFAFSMVLLLNACGFELRGVADLSFKTLYIQGNKVSISRNLNQAFKASGIKVVEKSEDAEMLLELLNETNEKRILSLSGKGVVSEYELNYKLSFRTRAPSSPTWSSVQTVQSQRNYSYSDNALLAKADEEVRLNTDMRNDAVREVLRRLTAIKPTNKNLD